MPLDTFAVAQAPSQSPVVHLLEEFSHRVLNEYTVAIGDLSVAASRSASERARSALYRAAERLRLHADAHRALLAPRGLAMMELSSYLDGVCASTCKALLGRREIRLIADMDTVWLDPGRCWRIGLIVAELLRNAVRHGQAGCVEVMLSSNAHGISCIVIDNGRGAEAAAPGRGCRLVQTLAGEMGGEIFWRFTPRGCVAELRMPATDGGPAMADGKECA